MKLESIASHLQKTQLEQNTRRHFIQQSAAGLGAIWMATQAGAASKGLISRDETAPLAPVLPPHFGKAKRVIFIHLIGGPSQLELFDYKSELAKYDGKECPQEYLKGQRFAFIQGTPKMLGPIYDFKKHGQSGAHFSDRVPHLAKMADDLCFVKSMVTDQFNHGPAQLMIQTGNQNLGYPSIGSWATYGLGTENQNLPGFMVLLSGGVPRVGKSLWGSSFLPSVYQGVQCRSSGDPVLSINNPKGTTDSARRAALDTLKDLNHQSFQNFGDPETLTRISQYEMAYRMQMIAPEVMDITKEPAHIHKLYGTSPGKESFANNCLLARRLAEAGTRFIQLYDMGWDSHGAAATEALDVGFTNKCQGMDQPVAALIADLKQRGLLEDTLLVWGTEFGRTPMQENRGGGKMAFLGRDHNPNAFTYFMAGAGVKAGHTHGKSDSMGYHVAKDPVNVRDFQATLLHLLGHDHNKLSVPFQGLNQKLTGVKPAKVVRGILS